MHSVFFFYPRGNSCLLMVSHATGQIWMDAERRCWSSNAENDARVEKRRSGDPFIWRDIFKNCMSRVVISYLPWRLSCHVREAVERGFRIVGICPREEFWRVKCTSSNCGKVLKLLHWRKPVALIDKSNISDNSCSPLASVGISVWLRSRRLFWKTFRPWNN